MTNTMSCGCEIISDNLGAYKIEYCPKHGAADDMYEALKDVRKFVLGVDALGPTDGQIIAATCYLALVKAGERCIP